MRRLTALGGIAGLFWLSAMRAEAPSRDDAKVALARIASAFRDGRAHQLRELVLAGSHVRVDVRNGRSILGSYGPGQFEAVLARLFSEHETLAFEFQPGATKVYGDTAFARASWVRRQRDQPQSTTQMLTFGLWRENGDWRLAEIRSSPAP
jgi:SnoaL-like domain